MQYAAEKTASTFSDEELSTEIKRLDARIKSLKNERAKRFYEAHPTPKKTTTYRPANHGGKGLQGFVPAGYQPIEGRSL